MIREHQYRAPKLRLEAELAERNPALAPAARQRYEELLKKFGDEEKRYGAEKKDIMCFFSLVLALCGALLTVNGYTLLFRLPLLHH